jgi:predicted hotdog family 3-hydroxylacyl-ACP dehydratase
MLIDRYSIAGLIPHAQQMCLLDGVLSWDGTRMRCTTNTHRAANNPLRRNGRLGILCGVEYAAQAMALHSVLAADAGPARFGYLASVRALVCHVVRLDLVAGSLTIEIERLHGDGERAIYGFSVHDDGHILLSGRAAVVSGNVAA